MSSQLAVLSLVNSQVPNKRVCLFRRKIDTVYNREISQDWFNNFSKKIQPFPGFLEPDHLLGV